ncbi:MULTISPECIES: diacylglycerol/lipid kinase family protein [Protofrankia]|uniref:Diacylglycerol kinase catalytic region n=1 Tax=Candidatus Protofrankia datiscae TaxID=2716812 RepID=F8AXY4_9ACTN|nr:MULTISPECIES: diacylglycerol kinase family protein [Protofrankia]AEH08483.1 diacylglycerol kinase catalytic region [Candidatus Protofrankia datiscae]
MRALLVVNPLATATTQRIRDVLVSALAADLHLETVATKGRGHAIELAERATDAGVDLVVAFGGDGTVNEIANGLLRAGPVPGAPALAVVPGGSTNVFARALGYSASPVEATGELLEALREGRSRRIGLGHATFTSRSGISQSRWFTFCAGLGVDAAVVERVERKRVRGRRNTPGLYLRSALGQFVRGAGRHRPPITITTDEPGQTAGAAADGADPGTARPGTVQAVVVCNTTPWTYLDSRLVRACPAASFDAGLDLLGLRRLTLARTAHAGLQMLHSARGPHGKNVRALHDQRTITLTAARELPFQMDGEYIGPQTQVTLRSEPRALRVIV